jgi:hypothetical protein
VQPTFRLASRLRIGGGLWMVRHFRLSRDVRQLGGRGGPRTIWAPPGKSGKWGRSSPTDEGRGFPRPKLELPRLRRSSCRRRTLCLTFELLDIGGDPQQQLLCSVATREAATASDGEALSEPCPAHGCS